MQGLHQRDLISMSCDCGCQSGSEEEHPTWDLNSGYPAPTTQGRQACSLLEPSIHPTLMFCSDTIWLHVRSQGQWTNRLYESFKASDPVGCGSKRLSRSLKMRRSQRRPQVGGCGEGRVYSGGKPTGTKLLLRWRAPNIEQQQLCTLARWQHEGQGSCRLCGPRKPEHPRPSPVHVLH